MRNKKGQLEKFIKIENMSLKELQKELKTAKESLDSIEQWIISDWYLKTEDYLHGQDNWKEEIQEHEDARLMVIHIKNEIKDNKFESEEE